MGSGMRWDKAARRDQAARSRRMSREETDAAFRRVRRPDGLDVVALAAWEWPDGLILGVIANGDSPSGKSFARFDRTRGVWTGKMQPWMVERVSEAWEGVREQFGD